MLFNSLTFVVFLAIVVAPWAFMLFMLVITQGSDSAFIYFQF